MRPKLTPQEVEKVLSDLRKILTDAKLIDECPEILWDDILQKPRVNADIVAKIKGRYFDKYVALLNRLK